MAEKSTEGPKIALIDTNVIITGAIDFAGNVESAEARIWSAFLQGKLKVAFSDRLFSEVLAVARRLMGKDFASKLRSQIIGKVEVISKGELAPYIPKFLGRVPREDVVHAALAVAVGAKYIVSNNRKFLRSLGAESGLKCLTPESFVEAFRF